MRAAYEQYIGGEFTPASTGETYESTCPATGERLYAAPQGDERDVDAAVKAASRAFAGGPWSRLTATDRGRLLRRLAAAVADHQEELARVESADSGRLLRDMRGQVASAAEYLHYYGGLADKVEGVVIPPNGDGRFTYALREPLGVIGALVPWNAPLGLAIVKVAAALAAGNAVVLKPSEHTAASILELMVLAAEVGVPPGIVNIVTGGPPVGKALAAHPGVNKISFTGGTETGRSVAVAAARRLVGVTLELGGKSPQIVFPDADLGAAAEGIAAGIFSASGQSCVAGSRAYIHAAVYDELVHRITTIARSLRLGDPMDDSTEMGPLCFEAHRNSVASRVGSAVEAGADLMTGGNTPDRGGWFYEPTILAVEDNDHDVVRREVFGPVLAVMRWEGDCDEVIGLANQTDYGLAAGVWTKDVARAHRTASRIDAGSVWINTYRAYTPLTPMGGFKESGLGKEGGIAGIEEFLRMKVVSTGIANGAESSR